MMHNFLQTCHKYVSLNQQPALTDKEAKLSAKYSQSVVQTLPFSCIIMILLAFYFAAM